MLGHLLNIRSDLPESLGGKYFAMMGLKPFLNRIDATGRPYLKTSDACG